MKKNTHPDYHKIKVISPENIYKLVFRIRKSPSIANSTLHMFMGQVYITKFN